MRKRNWNTYRATSRADAVEACVYYARDKHNLSVEQIAERAGLNGHHPIYKWMSTGDIPSAHISPFQQACGCTYFTDYLTAFNGNKLVIDMPTGRRATAIDINKLQRVLSETVTHILDFTELQTSGSAQAAISSIKTAMEDLAYHKHNIEKSHQPELEFD